jgi:cytochrome c-type biogenesis protein CcmH/NrfF
VAVTLRGLVQQVEVPAGDYVVTFRYRPPHLEAAVLLSLGAVLALLGLAVVMLVRRRRRVG